MINLPSPCPSVSRAGVVPGADVQVSSEAEEQILKSPIGGQSISDQAAEKKSSDTICTENDDSKSGEPNKGKRARKRKKNLRKPAMIRVFWGIMILSMTDKCKPRAVFGFVYCQAPDITAC